MTASIAIAILFGVITGLILGIIQVVLSWLFQESQPTMLIFAMQLVVSAVIVVIAFLAIDEEVGMSVVFTGVKEVAGYCLGLVCWNFGVYRFLR